MPKRRRTPRRHTVHTRDPRYNVNQYPRGDGEGVQTESTPVSSSRDDYYLNQYNQLVDLEYKYPKLLHTIPPEFWRHEYLLEKAGRGHQSAFRYIDVTYDDQSYYGNLRDDLAYHISEKGRTYDIKMMSPQEYFEEIARNRRITDGRKDATAAKERRSINDERAKKYADLMKEGVRFPLPNVDYTLGGQEGRHRARALEMLGVKRFPVLIARDIKKSEQPPPRYLSNYQPNPKFQEWKRSIK